MLFHQLFQRPGFLYRDSPAPPAPSVPTLRWIKAEIFLAVAMLSLLPSFLTLALLALYFTAV